MMPPENLLSEKIVVGKFSQPLSSDTEALLRIVCCLKNRDHIPEFVFLIEMRFGMGAATQTFLPIRTARASWRRSMTCPRPHCNSGRGAVRMLWANIIISIFPIPHDLQLRLTENPDLVAEKLEDEKFS
jgi:hypothetical protein